ncbi:Hypothetical protein SMAX5B_014255 [Scophthalmus maximus]|uniref:Uncharacterized protein n=1 Tax=Scophthalmus maximus TaxID=52904 RepID=A0A2U9BGM5_SCOMX|nr:Hypothetical protein SMAX5B_014394 [Scophthalmus maximus]AWP03178.1 Hypothetical protein SMAX5B_014255 [Scophthalmus maximus]KAF0035180.1 hypothetical protein F2P81_012938 [Scophthalmus maximus]
MAGEDFNVFDHMKWFDEEPSSQTEINFVQQLEAVEQKIGALEKEAAALGEQVATLTQAVRSLESRVASDEHRGHPWRRRVSHMLSSLRSLRWLDCISTVRLRDEGDE